MGEQLGYNLGLVVQDPWDLEGVMIDYEKDLSLEEYAAIQASIRQGQATRHIAFALGCLVTVFWVGLRLDRVQQGGQYELMVTFYTLAFLIPGLLTVVALISTAQDLNRIRYFKHISQIIDIGNQYRWVTAELQGSQWNPGSVIFSLATLYPLVLILLNGACTALNLFVVSPLLVVEAWGPYLRAIVITAGLSTSLIVSAWLWLLLKSIFRGPTDKHTEEARKLKEEKRRIREAIAEARGSHKS